MADLIDRKELRDALYEADAVTMQGVKIINQFPAVNAVEIVRCEKCKHWVKFESSLIGEAMCCTGQGSVNIQKGPDDFCSYGEKRCDDAN